MHTVAYSINSGCGSTVLSFEINDVNRTFTMTFYDKWMGRDAVEFKGSGTVNFDDRKWILNTCIINDVELQQYKTHSELVFEIFKVGNHTYEDYTNEYEGIVMGGATVNINYTYNCICCGYMYFPSNDKWSVLCTMRKALWSYES